MAKRIELSVITALLLCFASYHVNAQGALTPPGPPAPIYKTLDQIQPRTPIPSLPYIITTAGSYYLVSNLIGLASQDGVTIQADNVDVDLNGFSLTGVVGSHSAVLVTPTHKNLSLHNGTVQGWGSKGVDAAGAKNSQFWQLHITDNSGIGIQLGSGGAVNQCVVVGNGTAGVSATDGSLVKACTVSANSGDGILVGSSCYVEGNLCNTNSLAGIRVSGNHNRIDSNNLVGNGNRGLTVQGTANLVIRNSASESPAHYDIGPQNDYGQILLTPGAGFTNANPWANFAGPCLTGLTVCGVSCVNLTSDGNNCGSCGSPCSGSQQCVNSTCVCRAGLTVCLGACVNLLTDPHNCGSCGLTCPGAQACSGGSCGSGCATGQTNCSRSCVDLATDPLNCGSCGTVCSANQNCVASVCR